MPQHIFDALPHFHNILARAIIDCDMFHFFNFLSPLSSNCCQLSLSFQTTTALKGHQPWSPFQTITALEGQKWLDNHQHNKCCTLHTASWHCLIVFWVCGVVTQHHHSIWAKFDCLFWFVVSPLNTTTIPCHLYDRTRYYHHNISSGITSGKSDTNQKTRKQKFSSFFSSSMAPYCQHFAAHFPTQVDCSFWILCF